MVVGAAAGASRIGEHSRWSFRRRQGSLECRLCRFAFNRPWLNEGEGPAQLHLAIQIMGDSAFSFPFEEYETAVAANAAQILSKAKIRRRHTWGRRRHGRAI